MKETECEQEKGKERGRHRIWSMLQALSCQHRAWWGAQTHKPWDHDLSWSHTLKWLSHTGAPTFKKIFFKVYFRQRERERDRDRAWVGEGQREGDTESEAGSRLWAVITEPYAGLELMDREIMTWAKVGCSTDWATQAPQFYPTFITLKKRRL